MKTKILSLVFLTVFFLSLALVSAAGLTITNASAIPATLADSSSTQVSFLVTNTNATFASQSLVIYGVADKGTWSQASVTSLGNNTSTQVTLTLNIPLYSYGTTNSVIYVNGTTNGSAVTGQTSSFSIAITPRAAISLSQSGFSANSNGTLTIRNTGNVALNSINLASSGDFGINFSANPITSILYPGNSTSVIVYTDYAPTVVGTKVSTITANASHSTGSVVSSTSVSLMKTYCSNGTTPSTSTNRYLEIMSVKDTSSDTNWDWKPTDEISLDVKVGFTSNKSDEEIDAVIKIELYDTQTKKFIDFDNQDDLERDVSLTEDDETTESFTLQVPADDLEDSEGRYQLYVKIYQDGKESSMCSDQNSYYGSSEDGFYSRSIDITRKSRDVTIKNIEFTTPLSCGDSLTLSAKAYNIGTEDEDKVYVNLYNKELGLNLNSEVFALDSGDSRSLSFNFIVPKNVTAKNYDLQMVSYFKYNDNDDKYRDSSDQYKSTLKVESCAPALSLSISAELSEDTPKAVIGREVTVESTIRNTGTTSASVTVGVSGNSGWSSVSSISPDTITLAPGESRKVSITLDINGDAEAGEKTFSIRATSGAATTEQPVKLNVEESSVSGLFGSMGKNWVIWLIVIINIVLIIAIILVIVKIFSKSN